MKSRALAAATWSVLAALLCAALVLGGLLELRSAWGRAW